jgi:hypothetical protein
MTEVYQYLEISHFEHDFDNISQITKEDDSVYGLSEDLHIIRPKLQMLQKDYNDVLGKDVSEWIYNNYSWYFQKFSYLK